MDTPAGDRLYELKDEDLPTVDGTIPYIRNPELQELGKQAEHNLQTLNFSHSRL